MSVASRDRFDPDARPVAEVKPRINIVWMFQIEAKDDIVSGFPGECRSDDVESFGDVFGYGYIIGLCVDEICKPPSRLLYGSEHGRLVGPPEEPIVQMALHGHFRC